ncbi:MAG TPA: ankyrin repeat domain-containing protein [Steroidobacteraceae bacterium]|nr:ankyrin repeat domain-containing protein [Steroidobacteraceae bacterium]
MRIGKILPAALALVLLPVVAGAAGVADLIQKGDRQAALQAIRDGGDVNALQGDGSSPLLWAVHGVDHELVAELLKHGAKPNLRNSLGATALREAITLGDTDMVGMLLQAKADPNLGNADNETPLMLAARMGSLPMVQSLLQAGARVNEKEQSRSQTALMWAVDGNPPNPQVVDLLIASKAGVDVRAAANDWGNQITSEPRAQYRASGGLTPLLYATMSGCLPCVKSLLKAGADINRPTPDGVTPLMNAIDNNHYDVANYLLDQGANPRLFDWWGRTAVYLAADMRTRGGARGGPAGFRNNEAPAAPAAPQGSALQILQRLLEMGVDPNTQLDMHRPFRGRFADDLMTTGCTPLLRAALSVDKDAVALLLRHGALPDLPNVMGVTPLMAAAGIGAGRGKVTSEGPLRGVDAQAYAIAVIDMLLQAGADVNARITDTSSHTAIIARPSSMTDRQGQTALFGAVSQNWTRVAQHLLEHGARADIKDDQGKTLVDALTGKAGGRDTLEDRPQAAPDELVKLIKGAMGS